LAPLNFQGIDPAGREWPPVPAPRPDPNEPRPPHFFQSLGAPDPAAWAQEYPLNGQFALTPSGLYVGCGLNTTVLRLGRRPGAPVVMRGRGAASGSYSPGLSLHVDTSLRFVTRNGNPTTGYFPAITGWNTAGVVALLYRTSPGASNIRRGAGGNFSGNVSGYYVNVTLDCEQDMSRPSRTVVSVRPYPPIRGPALSDVAPAVAEAVAPAGVGAGQGEDWELAVTVSCPEGAAPDTLATMSLASRHVTLLTTTLPGLTCATAAVAEWEGGVGAWQGSLAFKSLIVRNV